MPNARRFSPTVVATVTPETVETKQGAKGPYVVMPKAVVSRPGKQDIVRTVLSFGEPNGVLSSMLAARRPVELALRFTRGTMTVVGLPKGSAAAAAPAALQEDEAAAVADVAPAVVEAMLLASGVHEDLVGGILDGILNGSTDRPSDEDGDLDPELVEELGHLLLPIVDAGIPVDEAVETARLLAACPIGGFLADLGLRRRQDAARAFI